VGNDQGFAGGYLLCWNYLTIAATNPILTYHDNLRILSMHPLIPTLHHRGFIEQIPYLNALTTKGRSDADAEMVQKGTAGDQTAPIYSLNKHHGARIVALKNIAARQHAGSAGPALLSHSAFPEFSGAQLEKMTPDMKVFLVDLHYAAKAADVVKPLFSVISDAGERDAVQKEFARLYAEARIPGGEKIPSRGYQTLEEIAEASGLNAALTKALGYPFRYGVINVYLDFGAAPNQYLHECSAALGRHSEFLLSDDAHGNRAHQTLHQIPVNMAQIEDDGLSEKLEGLAIRAFDVRGTVHKVNDAGMNEVFYDSADQAEAAANAVIQAFLDHAVMPLTTPPGDIIDEHFMEALRASGDWDVLYNLRTACFAEIPSVDQGGVGMPRPGGGSRFNFHSTYGKNWPDENGAAEKEMPDTTGAGGTLERIVAAGMGPNGTVVAPLASVRLQG
jgi:hypothetical protein